MINFHLLDELIEQANIKLRNEIGKMTNIDVDSLWNDFKRNNSHSITPTFYDSYKNKSKMPIFNFIKRINQERIESGLTQVNFFNINICTFQNNLLDDEMIARGIVPITKMGISCDFGTIHPYLPTLVDAHLNDLGLSKYGSLFSWMIFDSLDYSNFIEKELKGASNANI